MTFLKNFWIVIFLVLGLAACKDKTNYQGVYVSEAGVKITLEKINDSEYKLTSEIIEGRKMITVVTVKNNTMLYNSKQTLIGEIKGIDFVNNKGVVYSKIN